MICRCYILAFPPTQISPRKNEYILKFPPEKWVYTKISPRKNKYIPDFPPKKAGGKTWYILRFPPKQHLYLSFPSYQNLIDTKDILVDLLFDRILDVESYLKQYNAKDIYIPSVFFKWSSFFTLHMVCMALDLRTALLWVRHIRRLQDGAGYFFISSAMDFWKEIYIYIDEFLYIRLYLFTNMAAMGNSCLWLTCVENTVRFSLWI